MNRRYGKRWPGPHQRYPTADLEGLPIHRNVDPRSRMWPALDQGQLGSCTANATARCMRWDGYVHARDPGELSRRWIYHFEKQLEHTLGQGDTGAIGHDAFTVAHHGIPAEKLYPYSEDIAEVEATPPDIEPRAYTLRSPVRAVPQSLSAIKQVLSNEQTIALGFIVYESFEHEDWWNSGHMPMPAPGEPELGGHEVLAVGYLASDPHYALMLNSWGTGFGMDGYFLMPWAFLLDASRVADLRTIKR